MRREDLIGLGVLGALGGIGAYLVLREKPTPPSPPPPTPNYKLRIWLERRIDTVSMIFKGEYKYDDKPMNAMLDFILYYQGVKVAHMRKTIRCSNGVISFSTSYLRPGHEVQLYDADRNVYSNRVRV